MKSTRKIDYNDGVVSVHLDEGCTFGPNIFNGYCYALNEDGTEIVRTKADPAALPNISISGNGVFSMLKRPNKPATGLPFGRLLMLFKGMF